MNDFTGRVRLDERTPPVGAIRTVTVALDTAQYQMDMNYLAKQQQGGGASEDVYGTFNMLMRRKVGVEQGTGPARGDAWGLPTSLHVWEHLLK